MHRTLAELLKTRKGKYILFLGAGASLTSGGKTTREIVKEVVTTYKLDSHNSWKSFCNFLREKSKKERYDILSRYFENMKPSSGYETLANLIKEGYFRLILTTNFDFMLEEALTRTGLVPDRDYFVCIVGKEREDSLVGSLEDESIVRIVKLHGDYRAKILPFTMEETFTFGEKLKECLNRLTKEGIIFVGYSGMDRDVMTCLPHEDGSVWWVNPKKVIADKTVAEKNPDEYELNGEIYRFLMNRKSYENFIWGENGKSDIFFENIAREIFERDINSFCDFFKFNVTRYRKMRDLFEPPYQYEEMKQKLEKYKVLLILGEPHLGKTYTALNLLYDYYVEGFNVIFRSEIELEKSQREMLYEWEKLLKPNSVIYFEDPFGKTEPENVQVFRGELERIIGRIQNSESMVIMTSRLNVFKEVGNPEDFPMIIELMKKDKSYDREKRMRIIDKYVAVHNPVWRKLLNERINEKTLREYIVEKLTEPHNIDLFFEKSQKINNIKDLLEKVEESKEILKAFKNEIKTSSTVEKLFFYSCYIFERKFDGFHYFERLYPVILSKFKLDHYENNFDSFLKKYDYRIESYEGFLGLEIKFSHPDFSKAIEESFSENSSVIGRILFELVKDENEDVRGTVAVTVRGNFEKLAEEDRKILFELVKDENEYVRRIVAEIVEDNFDNFEKLAEEYRKILLELVRDEDIYVRRIAATTVRDNFEKLAEEYRKILLELVRDEDIYVRKTATEIVEDNFDNFEKLAEEYRKILLELVRDEDEDVRRTSARTVRYNFEKLAEEDIRILFELMKDESIYVRSIAAEIVGDNFEKLPEEYRKILFVLVKDKSIYVRRIVAEIVAYNFDKLTEEYKKLLLILSSDPYISIRVTVAITISKHFEKLPKKYQRALRKFKFNTYVIETLEKWIRENEEYKWQRETIETLKRELNL